MADDVLVKSKVEEKVAVLTISRPSGNKVNVLTSQVMRELNGLVDQYASDPGVRVLIITGEGPYTFVAGADIKEIASLKSGAEAAEIARRGQSVFSKIENLNKPVICAINAFCLGGGLELAMSCHFRIAAEKAKFGQPEILLGIIPGFGGTQRLMRICGPSKATELLLTGDQISAKDALACGLVNSVVPENRLLKEAFGLAKKIATKPKKAVELIMRAVREGRQKNLEDGLQLEAELFGTVCETDDMKEGVRAFLEKRQPKFQED